MQGLANNQFASGSGLEQVKHSGQAASTGSEKMSAHSSNKPKALEKFENRREDAPCESTTTSAGTSSTSNDFASDTDRSWSGRDNHGSEVLEKPAEAKRERTN
jgi:hypothetical protein